MPPGSRAPVVFPFLAILSGCAALAGWAGFADMLNPLTLDGGALTELFLAAFSALASAAAVGLWRGDAWVLRVMAAGWTLVMGMPLVGLVRVMSESGWPGSAVFVLIAFIYALTGFLVSLPLLYVFARMYPGAPLRRLAQARW
jgi:hypothetical protein